MKRKATQESDQQTESQSKETKTDEVVTVEVVEVLPPTIYRGAEGCVWIDLHNQHTVTEKLIDEHKDSAVFLLNLTAEEFKAQEQRKKSSEYKSWDLGSYTIYWHKHWTPSDNDDSDIHQVFGTKKFSIPYNRHSLLFSSTVILWICDKEKKEYWLVLFKVSDSNRLQHLSEWTDRQGETCRNGTHTLGLINSPPNNIYIMLQDFGDWSCLRRLGGYPCMTFSNVEYGVADLKMTNVSQSLSSDMTKVVITKEPLFGKTAIPLPYESIVILHESLITPLKEDIKIPGNTTVFTGHHLLAARDCLQKLHRREYSQLVTYKMRHYDKSKFW